MYEPEDCVKRELIACHVRTLTPGRGEDEEDGRKDEEREKDEEKKMKNKKKSEKRRLGRANRPGRSLSDEPLRKVFALPAFLLLRFTALDAHRRVLLSNIQHRFRHSIFFCAIVSVWCN